MDLSRWLDGDMVLSAIAVLSFFGMPQCLPVSVRYNDSPSACTDSGLHRHLLARVKAIANDTPVAMALDSLQHCVANIPHKTQLPAVPGVVIALLQCVSRVCAGMAVRHGCCLALVSVSCVRRCNHHPSFYPMCALM